MNSSGIRLCQSPLPVAPSGRLFSASRAHGSLRSVSKPSHLVSSSRLHRFSELEREKNKKNDMVRGGSLAMASSVFGAFSFSVGKMKNKATILASSAGDDQPSNAAQEKEGSVTGPSKNSFFERESHDNEIETLKLYAMAVSKDDPEEAQEILSKERQRWADKEAVDKLLMALVELLVYQRNHQKARQKINELLKDIDQRKDLKAKIYLLKAIAEAESESEPTDSWKSYLDELEREKNSKKKNIVRGRSLAMPSSVFGAFSLNASSAGDDQRSNAAQEKEGSVTGPLKKLKTQISFKNEPNDNEIEALKLYAMAISKDDPKEAQEILSKERQRWARSAADHTLLMSLVELLVYQGNYKEAKEKIEELLDDGTEGLRKEKVYLLKAIAESEIAKSESDPKKAEEAKSEANKAWEDYLDELSTSLPSLPPSKNN